MIIYLAGPYSHENKDLIDARVYLYNRMAAFLMDEGHVVFCPVCHSHPISQYSKANATDSDFWLKQDLPFLAVCDEMWIYKLSGWDTSKGVMEETNHAIKLGKPIRYI